MRRIKKTLLVLLVLGYSMVTNSVGVSAGTIIEGQRLLTKRLNAAYFNQYLEPNGSTFPAKGNSMCGAASGVVALSIFNKPIYYTGTNDYSFKVYMYKDPAIDKNGIPCGTNQGGAWTYTNINCGMSYAGGIQKYLQFYKQGNIFTYVKDFNFVKAAIDKGHPVIFNMGDSTDKNFGHIATIVGYTNDKKIIVHDTYTNIQAYGRGWRSYDTGKYAVYDLFSTRWPIGYLMEVV